MENQTNQLHLIAPETWSAEDIAKVNATKFDYTVIYPKTMKTGQTGQLPDRPGLDYRTASMWLVKPGSCISTVS